uniref:Uncharacterized protein n=1 Tax=Glossina palpalis gambiensis TaxID=67801 RepID=A0A1B0BCL1_9MUSC
MYNKKTKATTIHTITSTGSRVQISCAKRISIMINFNHSNLLICGSSATVMALTIRITPMQTTSIPNAIIVCLLTSGNITYNVNAKQIWKQDCQMK